MKLMAVMAHPDDAEIWSGGHLPFTQKEETRFVSARSAIQKIPPGAERLRKGQNAWAVTLNAWG